MSALQWIASEWARSGWPGWIKAGMLLLAVTMMIVFVRWLARDLKKLWDEIRRHTDG